MITFFPIFAPSKPPVPTTLTYSPLTPQNPADVIRADTGDTRRYRVVPSTAHRPMPPLKGLWETRTVTLFYRALSPDGDGRSGSLKALSGRKTVPAVPPPFRRTPHRPWLRQTSTVRRNLKRHPQLFRVNPLAGITALHRNALGYRYSSPNGDNLLFGIMGNPSFLPHLSVHCSLLTVHWTYTFSAKEKDSETGLSYFGSRYYSSDLSIWLSVDPMSDKYPHQSNYVYCSNNPLKVIDPNGEDEWEVNETGYIRHIHNDKPNRLYAVSGTQKGEWGERKSDVKPLDVNESIMNSIQTQGVNTSFFTENNREDMNGLFDFLADNTNVEWTQISSHLDGNKYDFLTTSHDNITTELPPGLNVHLNYAASKGFLDVLKHSHPNKYTGDNYYLAGIYPLSSNIRSEGDLNTKAILVQKNIQKNGFVRNLPLFILRNRGKNYEY